MSEIIQMPISNSAKRLMKIRTYFAGGSYRHGQYVLLRNKKVLTITGHKAGRVISLDLMDNGNIFTISHDSPDIVIISNDIDKLVNWNEFNDRHLPCYYCKHHMDYVHGNAYYDQYQCPVCKSEHRDH